MAHKSLSTNRLIEIDLKIKEDDNAKNKAV